MSARLCLSLLLALSTGAALQGCTEYWWQRGQPPSVSALLSRSTVKLAEAERSFGEKRRDVAPAFAEIGRGLDGLVESVKKSAGSGELAPRLETLANSFMSL